MGIAQDRARKTYADLFDEKSKIEAFDKIAEHFYLANFGTCRKTDMDVLMFSFYIEALIKKGKPFDDYTLSRQLGILQPTIRQLKLKKQLYYPVDYSWKEAFKKYAARVRWEKENNVIISIPDPNVMVELEHFIEEQGGYIDYQLNRKILKLPFGYYIQLLMYVEDISEEDSKKFEKELIKAIKADHRIEEKRRRKIEQDWKKELTKAGLSLATNVISSLIKGKSETSLNDILSLLGGLSEEIVEKKNEEE